ncbi:LPS export ABC transporter ATP-binding protein [Paludisphaera rhizosphaerae]|uniref:LPS export ABC transporter ATP-binding protein n=1 Tax=Paludisphaera rhizosphaerae TaxID=2711216 RepID=UPI0013ECF8C0|nr:LPS export ABC transporter ATP-binding protein [Paludisphaera rhizosphaerae]
MALLEVRGLEKWYGRRQVVNGVEFDVDQGEVVGLLGPNGAGKTTSFRMTIGLIDADGGSVVFDGRDVTRLPMYLRARAGMGYLAQDSSVFRQLTVEQNLMAILETRRDMSRKQKKDRLNDLMDRFGLNKIRHTKAHMVSGGERRRTEIARALITDPKLIMLDEPFAGIDPKTVGEIQEQIRDLVDTFHIGILLTDHQFRETLEVTDRCYVIREGRVFAYGDREQILNNAEVRRHYIGERFDGGHLLSDSHKPMSSIARTQPSLPPSESSKDAHPTPAPTSTPEAASPPAPLSAPASTAPPKPPGPPTVRIPSVSGPRPTTPKPTTAPPLPTRLVEPDDPEDVQSTIVNEDRGYVPGDSHSIQVNQIPPGFNIDDLYDK